VSRGEQRKRFLERIDDRAKNWKFSAADAMERRHWREYMAAYGGTIRETATPEAPWYVVPADNKWFTRLVVAAAVVEALDSLDIHYPKVTKGQRKQLAAARAELG
jgi:polyphosphate kinase 2 (PPK2 family)